MALTAINRLGKLIREIRNIGHRGRASLIVQNVMRSAINEFYKDVIQYFSSDKRSIDHRQVAYNVATRDEPNIEGPDGYIYQRGRPSLRLHKTTIGQNFDPLITTVQNRGSQMDLEYRIVNNAPHAQFYFEDVKPHQIPAPNGYPLVYHSGSPLPWNRYPGDHFNRMGIDHPGSTGKKVLLPILFAQRKRKMQEAARSAVEQITFNDLRKFF